MLLLAAFALRAVYMFRFVYYGDEYYTMLAITQTIERGAPILPSGLLYEKGLAYTYFTALLAALTGFSEALARWPSVLFGLLGVATMFRAGRGLFGSTLAGLVAAIALSFDPEAIPWGTRARMYALAQATLPLIFWMTWRMASRPHRRYLLAILSLTSWALLAHTGTAVLLPPLALAAGGVLYFKRRIMAAWATLTWPLALLAVLLVILIITVGLVGSATELPQGIGAEEEFISTDLAGAFFGVPEKVIEFFMDEQRPVITWLALGAALWALYRVIWKRSGDPAEHSALFITVSTLLTFLLLFALPYEYRRNRTIFLLLLPQLYLLSGVGAHWLASGLGRFLSYRWVAGGLVGLIFVWLAYPAQQFLQPARSQFRYDLAYTYVRDNWQPGDVIADPSMAPCYLYLHRCDYFLRELDIRGTDQLAGYYSDWYVGAPLVNSQSGFSQILASHPRVWFVILKAKLLSNFTPDFIQQILAQMELIKQAEDVWVFRSRPQPVPLPQEPDYPTDWRWVGGGQLTGYSVTRLDNNVLALTLFWQNVPLRKDLIISLSLRGPEGVELLQLDHIPMAEWPDEIRKTAWGDGKLLRDQILLTLPSGVDLAQTRLLLTISQAGSKQRWPLANDQSGENGVWLESLH